MFSKELDFERKNERAGDWLLFVSWKICKWRYEHSYKEVESKSFSCFQMFLFFQRRFRRVVDLKNCQIAMLFAGKGRKTPHR